MNIFKFINKKYLFVLKRQICKIITYKIKLSLLVIFFMYIFLYVFINLL